MVSLCSSRACLGKMIILISKVDKKCAVISPAETLAYHRGALRALAQKIRPRGRACPHFVKLLQLLCGRCNISLRFSPKTCLGTKPVLANRRVLFDEKKKFPVPQMDHFLRHLYKKRSFCQDRLGINIGKTQKRVRFFFAPGSARRCSEG